MFHKTWFQSGKKHPFTKHFAFPFLGQSLQTNSHPRCSKLPSVAVWSALEASLLDYQLRCQTPTVWSTEENLCCCCCCFCSYIDEPNQFTGDLLTYQTEAGWLVSCAVTVPACHFFLTRNICRGGGLEPYLWLRCLGHKGPRLGFSLQASCYTALVAWHQLTQHSCPGHPTKTRPSCSGWIRWTMEIFWLTDSPLCSNWD